MKPYEIEKLVRSKLAEMFGTKFRKGKLIIGCDSKKIPQLHEFDLISEDMNIVGEIKSGKCTRTNYNLALVDCLYLSKIKAQTKLMVLTDKQLYNYFKERFKGVVGNNIQAILVMPSASTNAIAVKHKVEM